MPTDSIALCCYFDRVARYLTLGESHAGLRPAARRDRQAEELALSCYGVEVRVCDAAGLGLGRRLRDTLPPEFAAPSEPAAAAVAYTVTAEARPGPAAYRVARDGAAAFATAAEGELYWWLRRDIDRTVARRSPGLVFVHAGVVGWRGLAVVIPGRGAVGKSTLVAELVRRGAAYYSDAFAVLDERGRVHPYRRTIGLGIEGHPHDLRLVRGDGPAGPLPLGLVVAGAYREGAAWRPAVVRGARAALPLVEGAVPARAGAARVLRIAARVAPTLVTLRGPRAEAAAVAAQLLDLVDDALVSGALGAESRPDRPADDLARVAEIRLRPASPAPARLFRRGPHAKRRVAIVIPTYRFPLTEDEQISLRHLREYLGGFDRYMIGPQSPPKEYSDFSLPPYSARYFADRVGYNRLLVSEQFYRAFADYEYILIYQLDCLVFSSDLEEWCRKGWDYVGAPWFHIGHPHRCAGSEDPVDRLGTVGNGGLSLRKVGSALAVLTSPKRLLDHQLMRDFLGDTRSHEDLFWSFSVPKLVDTFRIPRPREALKFSFEAEPRYCYRENAGRLPFGCHGWPNWDREFWEPFLLK
jgi:hypothetical protein